MPKSKATTIGSLRSKVIEVKWYYENRIDYKKPDAVGIQLNRELTLFFLENPDIVEIVSTNQSISGNEETQTLVYTIIYRQVT